MWNTPPLPTSHAEQKKIRNRLIILALAALISLVIYLISGPLSFTSSTPSVIVGGIAATLQFSGLAPGFVGLYQVNVLVPANAPVGAAVPVVVSTGSATSNTTTIAVQ